HPLRSGDVIAIGETQILFQSDEGAEHKTLPPDAAATPTARAPAPRLTDLAGKTISRYEVGLVIAKGTTGTVFRARDTKEDTVVALKVLQPEVAQNDEEM